jgi:hypothetical protein
MTEVYILLYVEKFVHQSYVGIFALCFKSFSKQIFDFKKLIELIVANHT